MSRTAEHDDAPAPTDLNSPRTLTVYRVVWGLVAAAAAFGLIVQTVLIFVGGTDANSGDSTAAQPLWLRLVNLFSYFTIQSNIVVLVAAALCAALVWRRSVAWEALRLDALLGITITGLVYELVLAGGSITGWASAANIALHYVVPWATVAAWLVLGPRPTLSWAALGWTFLWPVLWLAYTFVRGALTGWYPYPFLDVPTIGLARALVNAVVIVGFAFLLALGALWIDRHVRSVVKVPQEVPEKTPTTTTA